MQCAACGRDNPAGRPFCAGCGRPLTAAGGVGVASSDQDPLDLQEAEQSKSWLPDWALTVVSVALIIYSVIMGNIWLLLVAFAVAWVVQMLAGRLDGLLAPFWAVRNLIPRRVRGILAWVLPLGLFFFLSPSPQYFAMTSWLPIIGPDASSFIITTALAALIALLLIREPRLQRV
jgi:hypothetical protein